MLRTKALIIACLLIIPALALTLIADPAAQPLRQNLSNGDSLEIIRENQVPRQVIQGGRLRAYQADYTDVGVHFKPGREMKVSMQLNAANAVATTIMGVHGQGSHVRYSGYWQGDATSGFPFLVLTDGGRMTWEADARIDFVMPSNFFTRQLWVHGDGTGTLELVEDFVSDRTRDGTVADGMGTIRLGGANLITHHSQSLPYNSRPDGRGGIYHNGHVVFENRPGSVWSIRTNQHIYSAQIDFDVDGTLDCRAPLTHNGHRRDCLQVGNGGPFISTGAFRTTSENVTITKTGPAMLSLEGQQSYFPGSKLVIEEGLVRIYTDPGLGARVSNRAGPYLHIEVKEGGKLHFAAPLARLKSIDLHDGARMTVERDSIVEISDAITVRKGATLVLEGGEIRGKVDRHDE